MNSSFLDRIRTRRLTWTFVLLGTLSAGILAGSVITGSVHGAEQQTNSSDATPLKVPSPVTTSNAFSQIAKQVGPAVVNINTESLPKQSAAPRARSRRAPGGNDQTPGDMQDFFNRFFGGQGGQGGDEDGDGDGSGGGERRALGSGFIVDPKGYIITNNHVVDKADKIYVKLASDHDAVSQGVPAHVVGTDKDTDIAVIKIDVKQALPTVKLGNSDGAQVGDWVLAVGSPFSLSQTVTAGIVSAKDRAINDGPSSSQFQRFIQTDAAINPGNSGGPLVDMNGAVIGVNTAIYTQSMGSQGVGFAMPSNTVIDVYNMLISPDHKVTRGSIGIQFQAQTSSAVARQYGFSEGGVFVSAVTPGLPAAKAGIEAQDVIVSIDDKPVKDGDDLVANISARRPGSTVRLGYLRNGKKNTATVGIVDRTKLFPDASQKGDDDQPDAPPKPDAAQIKLGITVTAVPSTVLGKLGISGGVIVASVKPGSFADENGLNKGDVILEVNRKPITDEASFRAAISSLKSGDDVVFVIRSANARDKINSFVGGTLP
jgi:serine protease Do